MPSTPTSPQPTAASAGRLRRLRRSRAWRWGRWPLGALALLGMVGVGAFAYLYASVSLPDDPPELRSSVVLDAEGRELAVFAKDGLRVPVELDEVAPIVVDALLAAEDRDFEDHNGVDPRGFARAVVNNLRGNAVQGGSTITQQLVKNAYLSPERSYERKAKEAVLAIKLEQTMDKDEILERYLNTVYFGRGAYGIEAAAREYYDVHADALTVPQAALLVGLLRSPESAEPSERPEEALARRNSVIGDLAEVGVLTEEEAEAFAALDLTTIPPRSQVTLRAGVGAHVIEWVRQEAVERFGEEAVYGGGLVITTTIDLDQQRMAEEAVRGVLDQPEDPEAALVALDASGGVTAHVGGRDAQRSSVDLARGRAGGGGGRQAGSAFKPVVLAAALDRKVATLATRYPAPAEVEIDLGGETWTVGNYGGSGYGEVDLAEATTNSVNTSYAELMMDVGPQQAVETAQQLGIRSELRPDPSLVLGTGEVSVLDIASTYATFGRDGRRIDPYVIRTVVDQSGRELFANDPGEGIQTISPETAHAVSYALEGVVERGTGTAAQLDRPVAGKTGTTQGNGDAWFAGYTPSFTAVVWMGYPEGPQRAMTDVHGRAVTGGSFPAEIWRRFAEPALADVEPEAFPPPPDELLRPLERPEGDATPGPGSTGPVAPMEAEPDESPSTTVLAAGDDGSVEEEVATDLDPTTTTTAPEPPPTTAPPPATTAPPQTTTTVPTEPDPAATGGGTPA